MTTTYRFIFKKTALVGLRVSLGLGLCGLAKADLIIKQQLSGQEPTEAVMWVKGSKIRTDVGKEKTAIINVKSGEVVTLIHQPKLLLRTSGELMRTQLEKLKRAEEVLKPVPTGVKEVVNGHECEIHEMNQGDARLKLWVARQFFPAERMTQMKKDLAVWLRACVPLRLDEKFRLDGIVVKVEMESAGMTSTTLLTSIEPAAVDESIFINPETYREVGGVITTAEAK
jgi:hypothetical protein